MQGLGQDLGSAFAAHPWAFIGAVLLVLAALTIAALLQRQRDRSTGDPLKGLYQSAPFADQDVLELDRRTKGVSALAVLHGRIDHFAQVGQVWGTKSRADAIEEVARVLRAGVRSSDDFATADLLVSDSEVSREEERDGSFIIHAHGASEEEASGIAQRLRQTLAHMPLPGLGENVRLSASFGVAEQRAGEDNASLYARAHAALMGAQSAGEDAVLSASEWEEIKLLPAPAASLSEDGETRAA